MEKIKFPHLVSSELERFFNKIDLDGDCWVWIGARTTGGYGKFKSGYIGLTDAHRLSHYLFNGEIEGKIIMHSCDTPACVNPAHLKAGTHSDNTRDMYRKGRGGKTTLEDRINMIKLYKEGNTVTALSKKYGIDSHNVTKIIRGERYAF